MPTALRFATDEDIVRLYPSADKIFPRIKAGKKVADWDGAHQRAMDEIERWLRTSRGSLNPGELGNLGLRSRDRLRDCAAYLALHHLCADADIQADDNQLLERKASYFWTRAEDIWRAESQAFDYDADRDGDTDTNERNQPFPSRVIRG